MYKTADSIKFKLHSIMVQHILSISIVGMPTTFSDVC